MGSDEMVFWNTFLDFGEYAGTPNVTWLIWG